jgi:positive regulator of sigma E activity
MRTLYMMSIKNIVYSAVHVWLLVFVDVVAIIGAFWLIRSYRRTLRAQKKQQQDEENAEKGMYNE